MFEGLLPANLQQVCLKNKNQLAINTKVKQVRLAYDLITSPNLNKTYKLFWESFSNSGIPMNNLCSQAL